MQTTIPYDFMPPEQHFSSPADLLSSIEAYQQTRAFVSGDTRFNPPEGTFELLSDEEDGFVLMPAAKDYAFLFRGQGAFFNECLPTLLREKRSPEHMFLERMRVVEFELMLKQYPAVRFFEQKNLSVDYVGLAQHYGLLTDVLDLTSDVRTALFFAMCDYDDGEDSYHPKTDDRDYVAYLYAFPVINDIGGLAGGFLKKDLRVIGLQPFTRPGSQRGFSFHVREGNPFKGYLYSFSFTRQDSEKYYDLMINKRHVWDKDFIVEKTHLIKTTQVFTGDALALANKRYGLGLSINGMQRQMNNIGIHFSGDVPWRLSSAEITSLSDAFEKELKIPLLQQIVSKTMQSGGNHCPVMPLSAVGNQLMIQAIQGGQPSVDGYSSGITINLDDNPVRVGWSFDMNRPQTVPDAKGRVTAFDEIINHPSVQLQEAINKRAVLKAQVDAAVAPLRPRRVFVPNDGSEKVYLD